MTKHLKNLSKPKENKLERFLEGALIPTILAATIYTTKNYYIPSITGIPNEKKYFS